MRRFTIILFLILSYSFKASAQKDTLSAISFWNQVLFSNVESVEMSNLFVKSSDLKDRKKLDSIFQYSRIIPYDIDLNNIEFEVPSPHKWYHRIEIRNVTFQKNVNLNFTGRNLLSFSTCTFTKGLTYYLIGDGWMWIDSCSIVGRLHSSITQESDLKFQTGLKLTYSQIQGEVNLNLNGSEVYLHLLNSIIKIDSSDNSNYLLIQNSEKFTDDIKFGVLNKQFIISGKFGSLLLFGNKVYSPLLFLGSSGVSNEIRIDSNHFSQISLSGLTVPESPYHINMDWLNIRSGFTYIDWEQHRGLHVEDEEIVIKNDNFQGMRSAMNQWYTIFKAQGKLESANQCYSDIKLMETRRWKYLYQQNKTFESFFRWQLNSFLSYFTDYGTNPAKAVIKSGWVILLFAIFYLFFPSDWDVSNRSQLLSKIKDLTSENREKSILATIAFIAYSGLIHILNALTLSLNAFTTLGFGDIPTHGAARYVTIVQGFIGWFLLTIFSVSLINQVLG
ncbi:MAG: ion channel [Salibacteraceae bacterium]